MTLGCFITSPLCDARDTLEGGIRAGARPAVAVENGPGRPPTPASPLGLESLLRIPSRVGVKRGNTIREALQPGAPSLANTAITRLRSVDGPISAHSYAVRVGQLGLGRGPTVS